VGGYWGESDNFPVVFQLDIVGNKFPSPFNFNLEQLVEDLCRLVKE
jgi:hypothetical protein